MSEFIKTQQEIRANLTHQIRDVIDGAEAEKRGLDAAEIEKINKKLHVVVLGKTLRIIWKLLQEISNMQIQQGVILVLEPFRII